MSSVYRNIEQFHTLTCWNDLHHHPNDDPDPVLPAREKEGSPERAIPLKYRELPGVDLTDVLASRTSVKEMKPADSMDTLDLGTVLKWSAGSNPLAPEKRMYPSAGAQYPVELFCAVKSVKGIAPGLYRYHAEDHSLVPGSGRFRIEQALLQEGIEENVCLIVTADWRAVSAKYGERAYRFCLLEAGHLAQNVLLVVRAAGFDAVPIGGFRDREVPDWMNGHWKALYLIPVGSA